MHHRPTSCPTVCSSNIREDDSQQSKESRSQGKLRPGHGVNILFPTTYASSAENQYPSGSEPSSARCLERPLADKATLSWHEPVAVADKKCT